MKCVTKQKGEKTEDWTGYKKFILRAASHPVALRVKLADLDDNIDIRRISNPTGKDFARIKKYRRAYALLKERRGPEPLLIQPTIRLNNSDDTNVEEG